MEFLEDRTLFYSLPAGFQITNYVSTSGMLSSMKFLPNSDLFYTSKGGNVKLVNLNRRNIELLVMTKLATVFEIFND